MRFQGGHIQNVVNLKLGLPAGNHSLGEAKETFQKSREKLLAEAAGILQLHIFAFDHDGTLVLESFQYVDEFLNKYCGLRTADHP
jgi:hypothetical protein